MGRREWVLGWGYGAATLSRACEIAWVPACAGMTEGAQGGDRGGGGDGGSVVWAIGARCGLRRLAAFHPSPNLPPSRGEG